MTTFMAPALSFKREVQVARTGLHHARCLTQYLDGGELALQRQFDQLRQLGYFVNFFFSNSIFPITGPSPPICRIAGKRVFSPYLIIAHRPPIGNPGQAALALCFPAMNR